MRNALLCVLAGLAVGFAASTLFRGGAPDTPLAELSRAEPSRPAQAAPEAVPPEPAPPLEASRAAPPPAELEVALDEGELGADPQEPLPAVDPVAALTAVGFTPARAAEILRREAELRQAAYVAEYESSGTIRPLGGGARGSAVAAALRAELGDADYERYLEGTEQPRSVVVRGVEADSAAAHAGILPGDEIRAYAGQRVFNQRDLSTLMLAGTPGEVVPATVVRDGQSLQLYVTRGPLGLM